MLRDTIQNSGLSSVDGIQHRASCLGNRRTRTENQADTLLFQEPIILLGITPPAIMMSSAPNAFNASINWGTSVLCPAAKLEAPTIWTSFSTA